MISQKLLEELEIIMRENYQVELTPKETKEVADTLVKYGELAVKVFSREKNNKKNYETNYKN